jgi:hypothetical protein
MLKERLILETSKLRSTVANSTHEQRANWLKYIAISFIGVCLLLLLFGSSGEEKLPIKVGSPTPQQRQQVPVIYADDFGTPVSRKPKAKTANGTQNNPQPAAKTVTVQPAYFDSNDLPNTNKWARQTIHQWHEQIHQEGLLSNAIAFKDAISKANQALLDHVGKKIKWKLTVDKITEEGVLATGSCKVGDDVKLPGCTRDYFLVLKGKHHGQVGSLTRLEGTNLFPFKENPHLAKRALSWRSGDRIIMTGTVEQIHHVECDTLYMALCVHIKDMRALSGTR